ncbi:hypothetical protein D3C86_1854170 [compost metagenome]
MSGCLGFGHDLDAHAPFREVTALDSLKQVALSVIRIRAGQARSICGCQVLDPLLGLVVPLDPMTLAVGINQAISVATKAVHVTVTIRDAAI